MLKSAIISLYLLFAVSCVGKAQDGNYDTGDSNISDTVLYKHDIVLPVDSINDWKADKKFAYLNNLDSLLKTFENKVTTEGIKPRSKRSETSSSLNNFFSSIIVQVLFWGLVIGMVIFILVRLFASKGTFRRSASAVKIKEVKEDDEFELKEVSDYEGLIQRSINESDFRMAVRYQFLKTLRRLTDRGLLQRSVDKTNYRYVQEITPGKRDDFSTLVLNYEYIWYGHLNINPVQYEQVEKKFISFNNKIM